MKTYETQHTHTVVIGGGQAAQAIAKRLPLEHLGDSGNDDPRLPRTGEPGHDR